MEPAGFNHHGLDHSGPSSRVALPSARMSAKKVFKALGRYTEESCESDRQTEITLGVNRMTLTTPASHGLMSAHAFFEYRAKPMSTQETKDQREPIHCFIKQQIDA